MAGLRTSLQGRASLGALVSLGHIPTQGGGGYPINGQRILWDPDYDSDCDDVAELALLLQLQKLGECTIIAVGVASNNVYAAPAVKASLAYAGRGQIQIGAYQGTSIGGGNISLFTQQVVNAFGSPNNETRSAYDTAVNVYRRALAASPDGSVKIIIGGTGTNIAALLQSAADGISPLTGAQLVAAKVSEIHVMAGAFQSSTTAENNVLYDIPAANVIASSAAQKIYNGYEVGNDVYTLIPNVNDGNDPFRLAWSLYNPGNDLRSSWGCITVLTAVRGLASGLFSYSALGNVSFADPSSYTTFTANASGTSRYASKVATADAIATVCNDLISAFMRDLHVTGGIQDQALAEWTMDEGGSFTWTDDRSGRARRQNINFTASQRPTWLALGSGKPVLDFATTQVMTTGYTLPSTERADMIINAVAKFDTIVGTQQIVTRVGGGTQKYQLRVVAGVLQYVSFNEAGVATTLTFGSLTAGVWYRIQIRISGTEVKAYVNGVQSGATGTLAGTQRFSTVDNAGPWVGARNNGGSYIEGMDGQLSYLSYYPITSDVALIDARMAALSSAKGITF